MTTKYIINTLNKKSFSVYRTVMLVNTRVTRPLVIKIYEATNQEYMVPHLNTSVDMIKQYLRACQTWNEFIAGLPAYIKQVYIKTGVITDEQFQAILSHLKGEFNKTKSEWTW